MRLGRGVSGYASSPFAAPNTTHQTSRRLPKNRADRQFATPKPPSRADSLAGDRLTPDWRPHFPLDRYSRLVVYSSAMKRLTPERGVSRVNLARKARQFPILPIRSSSRTYEVPIGTGGPSGYLVATLQAPTRVQTCRMTNIL